MVQSEQKMGEEILMTVQERLRRSNMVMLVVPVVIAGILLAVGLGALVLLLDLVYLPKLGWTLQDLHDLGEQAEVLFSGLKSFVVLYAVIVVVAFAGCGGIHKSVPDKSAVCTYSAAVGCAGGRSPEDPEGRSGRSHCV